MVTLPSLIDGLVQERRNSIANALELRLSCTNHRYVVQLITCLSQVSLCSRHCFLSSSRVQLMTWLSSRSVCRSCRKSWTSRSLSSARDLWAAEVSVARSNKAWDSSNWSRRFWITKMSMRWGRECWNFKKCSCLLYAESDHGIYVLLHIKSRISGNLVTFKLPFDNFWLEILLSPVIFFFLPRIIWPM